MRKYKTIEFKNYSLNNAGGHPSPWVRLPATYHPKETDFECCAYKINGKIFRTFCEEFKTAYEKAVFWEQLKND